MHFQVCLAADKINPDCDVIFDVSNAEEAAIVFIEEYYENSWEITETNTVKLKLLNTEDDPSQEIILEVAAMSDVKYKIVNIETPTIRPNNLQNN